MNQADRKEFDLIHNKIDQIKEDIDDLKQTMNQAHTKTDESLSFMKENLFNPHEGLWACLLYTSPSPRDRQKYRMPSSA